MLKSRKVRFLDWVTMKFKLVCLVNNSGRLRGKTRGPAAAAAAEFGKETC